MTYRAHTDERHFTAAQRLAWDFVMPYMYLDVLDSEKAEAKKLAEYLAKNFSKQALAAALKRHTLPTV